MNFVKLKKILSSKDINTWNPKIKYYTPVKQAKLKDKKKIKYVLSKCGNALQCFGNKIKNDKELVLIGVKKSLVHRHGRKNQRKLSNLCQPHSYHKRYPQRHTSQ